MIRRQIENKVIFVDFLYRFLIFGWTKFVLNFYVCNKDRLME